MNYNKLRSRIIEKFGTYENFAAALGRPKAYVTRYMQNHSDFNQTTICNWCKALEITDGEIGSYFLLVEIAKRNR